MKNLIVNSYTSIEQSRILSEILDKHTADKTYERVCIAGTNFNIPEEQQYFYKDIPFILYSGIGIPCWSLASLLELLPMEIDSLGKLEIHKTYEGWFVVYNESFCARVTQINKCLLDACYEMILYLSENNLI